MSSGSRLLHGERILWTGRPVHARIGLAEAGMALYLAIAVIVLAVFGPRWLRGEPGLIRDMAAVVWAAAALQSLGMLVNLLVIGPRGRRRRVYEVTNYRIIVTGHPRLGDAASVYLDQVDEPTVRRNRNGTDDVVLRAPAGAPVNHGLTRLFESAGLGLAAVDPVTRLEGVRDAEQARLVIAEARQRMRDGEIDVFSPGRLDGPAPAGVIIAPDEDVLWTGRPARIPWWFGGYDIYLTAFALVWVACITCMAVWAARSGGADFLVFLVPFGLVGGVYPAAGRIAHRRLLIMRSHYVLTSRRLIATWRPLRGTAPVVVQAGLGALLPPTVRGTSILTGLASSEDSSRQRNGWKELTWPATTAAPPAVIGLANAQQVAELIGTAQIAIRAAVSK